MSRLKRLEFNAALHFAESLPSLRDMVGLNNTGTVTLQSVIRKDQEERHTKDTGRRLDHDGAPRDQHEQHVPLQTQDAGAHACNSCMEESKVNNRRRCTAGASAPVPGSADSAFLKAVHMLCIWWIQLEATHTNISTSCVCDRRGY